jgi:hypothetical protein
MNEQASAWLSAVEGLRAVHTRLKRVVILNRPALEVIHQQDGQGTLFYLDPPYLHATRASTTEYGPHEMSEGDEKAADVLANGGEVVLNSRVGDFAARVRELTDGRGVQAVYDGVGLATWRQSLDCLARRGCLVLYGQASGSVPPFDLELLKAKGSLYVTRPTVADYTASRKELLGRATEVFTCLPAPTPSATAC